MDQPPTFADWQPGPARPVAPEGEVHLWLADLEATGLSSEQALRTVLGRYLGEQPEAIAVVAAENGKPRLAERPERLRFNLSHSGRLALIGVAAIEVGVDVERVEPRRRHLAIAERRLSAAAATAVRAAPEERRAGVFAEHWVRFEARIKCLGLSVFSSFPADAVLADAGIGVGPGYAAAFAVSADAVPPSRRFLLG